MDVVEYADPIDAEPVEIMKFEQERVPVRQRRKRRPERLLVGSAVAELQVIQLRIHWPRELQLAFLVREVSSAPLLTAEAQCRPHRDDAHPVRERSATRVLGDPGATALDRNEEPLAHRLRDVVGK